MVVTSGNIRMTAAQADVLPAWLFERLGIQTHPAEQLPDEARSCRVSRSRGFSLASVRVANVQGIEPAEFERRVCDAYLAIAKRLNEAGAPHPLRFWNIIPDIHRPAGDGTDRYMSFNAGRFRALAEWFGGTEAFAQRVPAASGVGHDGQDLIIHALGAESAGEPISNPRQIAPYRYSRRFGPLPPCFARATLIRDVSNQPVLLVGGTASIRGEDSMHLQSLEAQTAETLENLACLVASACKAKYSSEQRSKWLQGYSHLRVYYPRSADRQQIMQTMADAFSHGPQFEFAQADLCRAELLIEIEGVAQLS
jgi:chorismate lyase/3-hydroxybenzoate synthase